jgi:hypothetical protein
MYVGAWDKMSHDQFCNQWNGDIKMDCMYSGRFDDIPNHGCVGKLNTKIQGLNPWWCSRRTDLPKYTTSFGSSAHGNVIGLIHCNKNIDSCAGKNTIFIESNVSALV